MPSTQLRQTVLAAARRIVVKVGTQVLAGDSGTLDLAVVQSIADQIAALRKAGRDITLVSSGAIGAGCHILKLDKRPRDIAEQQAVAAVGQRGLMSLLHSAFAQHGIEVAQLLLTAEDFEDRVRFLNIRNCISRLHEFGCLPVINENDTVATDELRFGDNDMLSALVTNLLRAEALVILSVVDGVLDDKNEKIDLVEATSDVMQYARTSRSRLGTGGIHTKLEAARRVTEAGELAVIANGREPNVLGRLFEGEKLGTVFVPARRKLDSRSRWIGLTKRPAGTITIDDGAVRALTERGKSLLAIGVTDTTGRFTRGDVVLVRDQRGREIARGLSNFDVDDLRQIMGKRSNQFEKTLGRTTYTEVIHRDNLVVNAGEDVTTSG